MVFLRIVSLVVLLSMFCFPSLATKYYVRVTGNDAAKGTSAATALRTLQQAVRFFDNGDTIIIGPGVYRESVMIANRFSADGQEMSIIGDESGKLTGDPPGEVALTPTEISAPVIMLSRVRNMSVSGLTISGPGQGITLDKSLGVRIERCTFNGLMRAVVANCCDGVRVESCVFAHNTIGCFLQASSHLRLAHNSFGAQSAAGIIILSCGAGEIRNSLFAENNTNFSLDVLSAMNWSSDYNVISGLTGPWGVVPSVANIAEWFSASGQDRHSLYVTPAFVNPATYDLHISPKVSWPGGLPGATVGTLLDPPVLLDRDNKALKAVDGAVAAGAYVFPAAVAGEGWKKLAIPLPAGVRMSAGIYRPDGTLLRMLLADTAGVREIWWDGLDDQGQAVGEEMLQVRAVAHDVHIVDDGAIGDNGNPIGVYNCDNADHVVALPNGGFVITTVYDEAGYPLRTYNSSGQPIYAANLTEGDFWGLALQRNDIIGGRGKGKDAMLVRLTLPGAREKMANGADNFPLLTGEEEQAVPRGLAVLGDRAYAALSGLNVVRVVDLITGKKITDWSIAEISDVAIDDAGTIWALSGREVVLLDEAGKVVKRYATSLQEPLYLDAGYGKIAVVDRKWSKLVVLNSATGAVIRSLGQDRTKTFWQPVSSDVLRDPRDIVFTKDGQLLITESARVRMIDLASGQTTLSMMSNFMETAVVHPTNPEYVYCGLGIFRVDPKSGAWSWQVEAPSMNFMFNKEDDPWAEKRIGSPAQALMLDKRPFIAYFNTGRLTFYDVTDPLAPRMAGDYSNNPQLSAWSYATITFGKDGDLITGGNYTLRFSRIKYKGLDAQNNPRYDFANPEVFGAEKDVNEARGMKSNAGLAADRINGDLYYQAVSKLYNKMVPGWGADGTGVGKSAADGSAKWFALSSGGNYMSVSTVNDGKNAWVLAGKSFGGQIDLFDSDGLRLATGNWGWPSNYQMGFVDLRFGVHAYVRPDGKVGAYVEDDAIGRFTRARVDGAETLKKVVAPLAWQWTQLVGEVPVVNAVKGNGLARQLTIPRVNPLKVSGDWGQWDAQQVAPQIVALPSNVGFKRYIADDLMTNFREGTLLGALAYDDKFLYVYFVATDNTQHFDAEQKTGLWQFDSIELWLEEEQFGLGFLKNGQPGLYKWRFHDANGKEWAANYALPDENVWAEKLTDLSTLPLGRQLAEITGVSFKDKPGYAMMARIPFAEVKLVGGYGSGRGEGILPMTGAAGEVVRVAVSLNNVSLWGRTQDYQIDWPSGKMYSDPTRSYPFVLGK